MLDDDSLAFYDFRDRLAGDLRRGLVRPDPAALVEHGAFCAGIERAQAADWTWRFLAALQRESAGRKTRAGERPRAPAL